MPKESLKDKLDGNELDLGLSNLTTVPVKELAVLPKATILDLSNNVISVLPDAFCTLTHLVKIDLSKNLLTELPDNFGALRNLQHLDLLGNKLSVLPVSFWRLEKLKWLDLKDNPLKDDLKRLAGDCLNETQCKKCAQNILRYMKDLNSELERVKQRRLQKERELEMLQKEREEEERKKLKEERKAEKEKRRQENKRTSDDQKEELKEESSDEDEITETKTGDQTTPKPKGGNCCAQLLISLFLTIVFMIGMLYVIQVYCDRDKNDQFCKEYGNNIVKTANHFIKDFIKRINDSYILLQNRFE